MDVRCLTTECRWCTLAMGLVLGVVFARGGDGVPFSGEALSALERQSIGLNVTAPATIPEKIVGMVAGDQGNAVAALAAEEKTEEETEEAKTTEDGITDKTEDALAPRPALRASLLRTPVAKGATPTVIPTVATPNAQAAVATVTRSATAPSGAGSSLMALSEGGEMPTLTVSASGTWTKGTWTEGTAPTTGSAKVRCTATAALDLDEALELDALTLEAANGATLTLQNTQEKNLRSGAVTVCGEGNVQIELGNGSSEQTAQALFLYSDTFTKKGSGTCTVRLNNLDRGTVPKTIRVAGGTLEAIQVNHTERTYKALEIAKGATFTYSTGWGTGMDISESLSGAGRFEVVRASFPKIIKVSGNAGSFTGTLEGVDDSVCLTPSDKAFGGSVKISQMRALDGGNVNTCTLGAGVSVAGTVTLGAGVTLTLGGVGKDAPTIGGLVTAAPVKLVLPAETALSHGLQLLSWKKKPEGVSFVSSTAFDPGAATYGAFSVEAEGLVYREFSMDAMPTLGVTDVAAKWSEGAWAQGEVPCAAPTVGPAKAIGSATGTLTFDAPVALDFLELSLTDGKKLTLDKPQTQGLLCSSDRVLITGDGNGEIKSFNNDTSPSLGQGLFLGCSTFEKRGDGTFIVNLNAKANNTSPNEIKVVGGTLKCYQDNTLDRTHGSKLFIEDGATFLHEAHWGNTITFGGGLTGKGTLTAEGNSNRCKLVLSGAMRDFKGTVVCNQSKTGVKQLELSPSDNVFGGSVTIRGGTGNNTTQLQLKSGLCLEGALCLGENVILAPEGVGDEAPMLAGGIFSEKEVTAAVKVPQGATMAKPLLRWAKRPATVTFVAASEGEVGGLYAQADGLYYAEGNLSLPEKVGSDEAPLGTLSGAAWQALAAKATNAAAVGSVTGTTKGGTVPLTAAQLDGALACFQGEHLITQETGALKVAYDFGISKLRFDGTHWQVTAKVGDGLTFVPGVTIGVYVRGRDEPLGSVAVEAGGQATVEIAISDELLKALGTHYLSVRVSR